MKPEEIKQLKNRIEAIKQDVEDDKALLTSILNRNMTRSILIDQLETQLKRHEELINALETVKP